MKYKELTEKIIKIFYKVYTKLGYGFLEKVYENAMMIELKKNLSAPSPNLQSRYFMRMKL
jgi:GxxExxY protein